MSPSAITGWLFDLYPSSNGLTVWLVDREGDKHCCAVQYVPAFFMHVTDAEARQVEAIVAVFPFRVTLDWQRRREIYSNEDWTVLRVAVHDTQRFKQVVQRLERSFPHFVFFNSDISVPQLFLYSTGLF